MDNDRKLLELAAKAAGIELHERPFYAVEAGLTQKQGGGIRCWNPLRSDGDALRLAVKLHIVVDPDGETYKFTLATARGRPEMVGRLTRVDVPHGDDPYAATRRAIVQVAANIGQAAP